MINKKISRHLKHDIKEAKTGIVRDKKLIKEIRKKKEKPVEKKP